MNIQQLKAFKSDLRSKLDPVILRQLDATQALIDAMANSPVTRTPRSLYAQTHDTPPQPRINKLKLAMLSITDQVREAIKDSPREVTEKGISEYLAAHRGESAPTEKSIHTAVISLYRKRKELAVIRPGMSRRPAVYAATETFWAKADPDGLLTHT